MVIVQGRATGNAMTWNRWTKRVLAGVLALAGMSGCAKQVFMEPSDYNDAHRMNLPKGLEENPSEAIVPTPVDRIGPGPATVFDPARPPRYLSLKEAIAIGLEQGNVGLQNAASVGFKSDQLPQFNGGTLVGSDAIRALALDPANIGANIERSLSKFDARWITSMSWQKNDQPVAAQFVSFQSQNDSASFTSTLAKPLPTGGVAGITFSTNYTKFPAQLAAGNNQFVNPNYTPRLQFIFEQPLSQMFGVEVNQLASFHPNSLLISGLQASGGNGVEGILLTRIRFDQAKSNFEVQVNFMLLNIEAAYWNLYSAYYTLYAQEEGLRQSFDGYRFTEARVRAGQDPPQNLEQARAQFELFRGNVYRSRGQVLETERQLRGLLGLRSDDDSRLVPIDEPNLAQLRPDFYECANEAMANRPELMISRQDLKATQLNVILAKNLRRPDIRMFSSYDMAGIGTSLDGPEFVTSAQGAIQNGNALTNFATNQFNSWQLGLRADVPLGFRDANAQVRQAQLALTRSYYQLRDTEMKTLEYLVSQHRAVYQTHALIAPAKSRREALQIFVSKTKELIIVGKWDSNVFFNYLQVQRDLAQSIAEEFTAIANYNIALAQLEFAKGTILRYNNVNLNEGPLPDHVAARAEDHFKERTAALVLRERAGFTAPPPQPRPVGPPTGSGFVAPPLMEPGSETPPANAPLPSPRPVDPKATPPMRTGIPMSMSGLTPMPGATNTPDLPVETATAPSYRPNFVDAPPRAVEGTAGQYFQPTGSVTVTSPSRVPTRSEPVNRPELQPAVVPSR